MVRRGYDGEKEVFNYRYEGLRAIGPPFAHVQIIFVTMTIPFVTGP
jgi:hypothetical protein